MLTLPIKKKWFDMIVSGKKLEEYREIKDYWTTRFINYGLLSSENHECKYVIFKNGYGKNARLALVYVDLWIGTGKVEWGAEPGKKYYILKIREVQHRRIEHE